MPLTFNPANFSGKTIVFCIPGNNFSDKFLMAWTDLMFKCKDYNIKIHISSKYTSNVYYVRNMCLGADVLRGRNQKPFNGQLNYDYIMWIDSDVLFTADQFFYMLQRMETHSNVSAMSGLYLMADGAQYATVKDMNIEYFKKNGKFEFLQKKLLDTYQSRTLMQVDYTGFGFIMFRKNVFERFKYPWFSAINMNIPRGDENLPDIFDFCSEDVSFCIKMRKKDMSLCILPEIVLKHEKKIGLI
jgi:hypothetical protein